MREGASMAGNWMMKPDPSIGSYDEVPWYRRTWFVVTMTFLFWPVAIIVAATGDIFQRATSRSRRESDAEVWRSTGTGRVVMAASGLILAAIYGPRLISSIGDLTDGDDRASAPPAVQAEVEERTEEPTGVGAADASDGDGATRGAEASEEADDGAATADEAKTSGPDPELEAIDRRLTEIHHEAEAIAETILGSNDLDPALVAAFGDDRYAGMPLVPDAQIDGFSLTREDDGDGRPTSVISATFLSTLDVDAAVEALAAIAASRGHVEDERVDETDEDGVRTVSLDHEPLADTPLLFEGLNYAVSSSAGGVEIRVFRFLVDDEPLDRSSLLERALSGFPIPDGYQRAGSEVSVRSSASAGAEFSLRLLGPQPNMVETEVFDAITQGAAPLWAFDSAGSNFIRLTSGPWEATVGVSPTSSSTIVRVRLS